MFGYVIANCAEMDKDQLRRYRSVYCGVCADIKERHGSLCRLALTYDMTFLVMLLSALYEPEERLNMERCIVHPAAAHPVCRSDMTAYGADMNVALAYYNCMDDWFDDHSPASLAKAKILKGETETLAGMYPRQMNAIKDCLRDLSDVEKNRSPNPDDGANIFGKLMGELFVRREDYWSGRLRSLGMNLGRFIYLMDACLDLKKDLKNGLYNPIASMNDLDRPAALSMFMADCANDFEVLPIVKDADILRNILYSGVWTRYRLAEKEGKL